MEDREQDPYYNDPPEELEPTGLDWLKLVVGAVLIAAAVAGLVALL